MLKFRIKIIEGVLSAKDSTLVKKTILKIIHQKIKKGMTVKRVLQLIPSLEYDMLFQMRLNHTPQEIENIKKALRVFREGLGLNQKNITVGIS